MEDPTMHPGESLTAALDSAPALPKQETGLPDLESAHGMVRLGGAAVDGSRLRPSPFLTGGEAMAAQVACFGASEGLADVIMHKSLPWLDAVPEAKRDYDRLQVNASAVLAQLIRDGVLTQEDLKMYDKGEEDE